MGKKGNSFKDGPSNLNPPDRKIQIAKLKGQLRNIAGGNINFGESPDCDPAMREAFLKHVLEFELQVPIQPLAALVGDGVDLPSPERLEDAALTAKLWELIGALADRHFFLKHTDHLGDRELYTWLLNDALREEYQGFGVPIGDWHLDILGGCSEEDLVLSMRYYANDTERKLWAAEFPDFRMPARERPPYDRDRLLPQPAAS